jgi:hypothetical protein
LPRKTRIEAEAMIPFGYAMGTTVQRLPRPNGNTEVVTVEAKGASHGYKVINLAALAKDVPVGPKQSGLVARNVAGGNRLHVASASTVPANLDLYVNGTRIRTLNFPATGDGNTFRVSTFDATIPLGSEVKIVYVEGRNIAADIDYIEIEP